MTLEQIYLGGPGPILLAVRWPWSPSGFTHCEPSTHYRSIVIVVDALFPPSFRCGVLSFPLEKTNALSKLGIRLVRGLLLFPGLLLFCFQRDPVTVFSERSNDITLVAGPGWASFRKMMRALPMCPVGAPACGALVQRVPRDPGQVTGAADPTSLAGRNATAIIVTVPQSVLTIISTLGGLAPLLLLPRIGCSALRSCERASP